MAVTGYIGVSAAVQARWTEFWDSFIGLDCPPDTCVKTGRGANIAANRNGHTRLALELGAEWIFYVDDDQVFAPDTLLQLLAADVPVISGLYLSRDMPFRPQVFDREDADGSVLWRPLAPLDAGRHRVCAVGAGCLLVRRPVLEAMPAPWWTLGQVAPDNWGDDVDFCRRVRLAGFDVWADLDTLVGHKVDGTIWPQRTPAGDWMTTLIMQRADGQPAQVAHFPAPQSAIRRPDLVGV